MTNPLFYSAEVSGATVDQLVTLDVAASAHAIRSQRLGTNDAVAVSDGAGTFAAGHIESPDPKQAGIRLQTVTVEKKPEVHINLVQALAKADRDLLAVEMATELGVDSVTPWQALRSIVRLRPDRQSKMLDKWTAKLQSAAQQARRAYIPDLKQPIVAKQVADLHDPQQGHSVLVLHEEGDHNIADIAESMQAVHTIHLVVGPEGGVSPEELQAVYAAGGTAVKIGSNVMRASTAGPVAIALLNQLMNRW